MCIYVFDKVLNCFWNLYSSLCSFCGGIEKCLFVDRCVTSDASLFQVFRQWRVAQNRVEGEKAKERNWERGGVLSLLALPPTLFSAAFLCTVPTTRTPGIGFSVASIFGSGRKKWPLTQTSLGVRHAFLPHPLTTSVWEAIKKNDNKTIPTIRRKLICYCTTCTYLESG